MIENEFKVVFSENEIREFKEKKLEKDRFIGEQTISTEENMFVVDRGRRWIGDLGEEVFKRWLKEQKYEYTH